MWACSLFLSLKKKLKPKIWSVGWHLCDIPMQVLARIYMDKFTSSGTLFCITFAFKKNKFANVNQKFLRKGAIIDSRSFFILKSLPSIKRVSRSLYKQENTAKLLAYSGYFSIRFIYIYFKATEWLCLWQKNVERSGLLP